MLRGVNVAGVPGIPGISGLGGAELLIIAAVMLVLFGASRLPGAARALGRSLRIFAREAHEVRRDESARAYQVTQPPKELPSVSSDSGGQSGGETESR